MSWFNVYGLLFVIIIMIPNIIFAITHKDAFENKYQNKWVEALEQMGRFGCFAFMIISTPIWCSGFWFSEAKKIYILLGIICVLSYCLSWAVFWKENSIRKSLVLSILPSILFIESGVFMLNMPLIIFSVIFACSHILISYKNATL